MHRGTRPVYLDAVSRFMDNMVCKSFVPYISFVAFCVFAIADRALPGRNVSLVFDPQAAKSNPDPVQFLVDIFVVHGFKDRLLGVPVGKEELVQFFFG
jgi:hypothetical protein